MLVLQMGSLMTYAVKMLSHVMLFLPSFMKIGTGVQATLRFCFSNMNGCKCWYCRWKWIMKYTVEMGSGVMIYAPCSMTVGSGIK
jgi:hypothetical protein